MLYLSRSFLRVASVHRWSFNTDLWQIAILLPPVAHPPIALRFKDGNGRKNTKNSLGYWGTTC